MATNNWITLFTFKAEDHEVKKFLIISEDPGFKLMVKQGSKSQVSWSYYASSKSITAKYIPTPQEEDPIREGMENQVQAFAIEDMVKSEQAGIMRKLKAARKARVDMVVEGEN